VSPPPVLSAEACSFECAARLWRLRTYPAPPHPVAGKCATSTAQCGGARSTRARPERCEPSAGAKGTSSLERTLGARSVWVIKSRKRRFTQPVCGWNQEGRCEGALQRRTCLVRSGGAGSDTVWREGSSSVGGVRTQRPASVTQRPRAAQRGGVELPRLMHRRGGGAQQLAAALGPRRDGAWGGDRGRQRQQREPHHQCEPGAHPPS
jgi:hypothetical protein